MPLNTMLRRSPSPASSPSGAVSFDTGMLSPVSAASAVCSAVDCDQARVGGDRVALLDQQDVAGHHLGGRDALPRAAAHHAGVRRRHAPQRGHGLLGARLLHVAHERVEQHDRQDGDRLVGQRGVALEQPQRGRDRGRDQQQDHQRIGELGEELPPGGRRLFGGQLVPAVALEPRPRLVSRSARAGRRCRAPRCASSALIR